LDEAGEYEAAAAELAEFWSGSALSLGLKV